MKNHLVVLTGSSRGLGLAMAEQLLARSDTWLLGIARHTSEVLAAKATPPRLVQWSQDLSQPIEAAARLRNWLAELNPGEFDRTTLINNAGLIAWAGPVEDTDPQQLSAALRVNLEAPVMLTAAFLHVVGAWPVERKVLNISSGLGRQAMAGSAAYCATKAGLDHFSRAIALEGTKVVSLAPGVIDTDMQDQLREADPTGFPDHGRFLQLKSGGLLDTPAEAAAKVLAWLDRDDFGHEPVADVRRP